MSAIDKLQQRPTLPRSLVQQAMEEAKTDPAAQQKLQQLVDNRAHDFESPALCDVVAQFLQGLNKDQFEVVANRTSTIPARPEVLEARITKVKDESRRVDITPPPPAPPVYRRDPLNITGKAPAGSTVEFYNASIPGRPLLGTAVADATGKFSFELTDETKFVFGDQIGVRTVGHDGQKSRPLIVPTEPFLITNLETTYFRRQNGTDVTVRVDHTSTQAALNKNTDDRPPFFQQALVDAKLDIPRAVEQPYQFTLIGKDDSVEPNSTITVMVGQQKYQTKVDDQGQFALKVKDVVPGQRLAIEVRDVNGNGVDIPARVPPISLPAPQLIGAMHPELDGVRIDARDLVPPGGALIVRNARTGLVEELRADQEGHLKGKLNGITPFDAFEIAIRDVNGHVSEQTAWLASLPAAGKGKPSIVDVSTLNGAAPDLGRALSCISGPPVDVIANGQKKPGGPFLPLTGLPKLPPHAVLEVVKDGAVVQSLRADENGTLNGMLRGVHVGDALTFQLRDAVGRLFPGRAEGFVVPDGKQDAKVTTQVPPALQPLSSTTVGSGTLGLDPLWLAPATIHVGKTAPTDFQQRHALTSQLGGAIIDTPDAAFMAAHAPDLSLKDGATLSVKQEAGRKTITVDVKGSPAQSFGWDDTLNRPNPPLSETDVPRLQQALTGAVAVVAAAYARGLEPGDIGYDRSLGVAKTLLFLLDHVAQQSPTARDAAQKAAVAVLGTKPFLLELTPKGVVGPGRALAVDTLTSSAKSLLQVRTLAMGEIDRKDRLFKPTHAAVDVAALSAAASFTKDGLQLKGEGLIAPGDELLIKAGDTLHRIVADAKGNVDVTLAIAPGTVVEIAQRKQPAEKKEQQQSRVLNPVVQAVVAGGAGLLGEGNLVPLSSLAQKAPPASAVANELFHDGAATQGLPPGGSVVIAKDGKELARLAIDENGTLQKKQKPALSAADLVDVRVLDAAGRPLSSVLLGQVVGQKPGRDRQDTNAMTISAVIDAVGSGTLALPTFGKKGNNEAHAELKPFYGPSPGVSDEHGRYSTKAAFAEGLLPDLAKGPEKRNLSMGDSVTLSSHQWDDGTVSLNAGYFVENQRPDFGVVFDPKTGTISDRWNTKTPLVPDGLAKLSTLLKTSLAFVALAQSQGSEPGDGFYDLAARTAKSALVVFDSLLQSQPTFATEIKAALRAALPPAMPFDLPVGNAAPTQQTPPTDNVPPKTLSFWNDVERDDWKQRDTFRSTWSAGLDLPKQPRRDVQSVPYFFAPVTQQTEKTTETSTLPLYLRGRFNS